MQIIVVSFLYHVCPKKSNSSSCFKDKISGLYKLISLFLVALQAKHYDNTVFHILKQN